MNKPKNLARTRRKIVGISALSHHELVALAAKLANDNAKYRHENRLLKEQATKDPLTEVYNRRGFYEKVLDLTAETKRINDGIDRRIVIANLQGEQRALAENDKESIVIIGIDIDHFKICNDKHGHAFGDDVLKKLAGVLKTHLRSKDIVARFGGEEFFVATAIKSINHEATARDIAEKIRQAIEKYVVLPSLKSIGTVGVTGSLGVGFMRIDDPRVLIAATTKVVSPDFMDSINEDLKIVDRALYAAKHKGRNAVSMATEFTQISSEDLTSNAPRRRTSKNARPGHPSRSQRIDPA